MLAGNHISDISVLEKISMPNLKSMMLGFKNSIFYYYYSKVAIIYIISL